MEQKSAMQNVIDAITICLELDPNNEILDGLLDGAKQNLSTESQQKKDEAIAFAEWKDEQGYAPHSKGLYWKRGDNVNIRHTTEQLYSLFKENNP